MSVAKILVFLQQSFYTYILMENPNHEIAKHVRHEFFVYRNGLLADTLRSAGDTHRMIFGLNMPQITDIARSISPNEEVAKELWESRETRECRLIAPILYPIDKFNEETALEWISDIESTEVADNLCHKLLRKTPFAHHLCTTLMTGSEIQRYTALRLAINLLTLGKEIDRERMLRFAQTEIEKNHPLTSATAKRLLQDLSEI